MRVRQLVAHRSGLLGFVLPLFTRPVAMLQGIIWIRVPAGFLIEHGLGTVSSDGRSPICASQQDLALAVTFESRPQLLYAVRVGSNVSLRRCVS